MTKHGAEPEAELFVTFFHDGHRWRASTWDMPPAQVPRHEVYRLRLPVPVDISGKALENARMEPYDPTKDRVECGAVYGAAEDGMSMRCHLEVGHPPPHG